VLGLAVWCAGLLGVAGSAKADFLFSPTGTGAAGAQLATVIDPTPGNALAQGGVNAIANFQSGGPAAGNTFQLYYQALVGTITGPNSNPITSGTYAGLNNTYQITVVASVTEVVTSVTTLGPITTATFAVAPTQTNAYLRIYQSPGVVADSLAGTGFNVGNLIYTGTPVASANGSGNFTIFNGGVSQLYDQHGADNYGGLRSVVGGGFSTIDFITSAFDPNFFLTPPPIVSFDFTTQSRTPFLQVDPSRVFTGLGPGGTNVNPNLGGTNGLAGSGPDFQFQADASATPVPEPSALALTGAGLVGLAALVRRRRSRGA